MTETVVVGTPIESVALVCDPVRVLRFGASTHNSHRIHYDASYAATEKLSAPVVMAQLQGTLFYRAAAQFAGGYEGVVSVSWQNRAPAPVGATLEVSGEITEIHGEKTTLTLLEHSDDGVLCAVGTAVVVRVC
ncbi:MULTISPECIES: acyl dehydratase [Rhodococcus]|uniref:acyl dehydratase n=1 Tax=Rhodococcus globerulus TaxID=33008 RepID=UPI001C583326|nr:acyl dehydratase [Rhodococcus globerulus]QXW00889.1 acyl dehydratase [Rhodococcus globerulus]